jgi:hypothetical protein
MTPTERRVVIRAIAEHMLQMAERQADNFLLAGGAESTPAGWGLEGPEIMRLQAIALLRRASDESLIELVELIPEDDRPFELLGITLDLPVKAETEDVTFEGEPVLSREADGTIFVVHGHALAAMYETVRMLERGTGREVIVLHEQANQGRTVIEKFEEHAASASFAVVLLTGDDEGRLRANDDKAGLQRRGRQNVVFECGFFFAKLGRGRVAVLLEDGIEKPSDVEGLVYIVLDQYGAWKQALARELEAAGIPVDRARIP